MSAVENRFVNKQFRGLLAQMSCVNKHCIDFQTHKMVFLGVGKFEFFSQIQKGLKCEFCPQRKTNSHPDMKCIDLFANKYFFES